MVRKRLLLGSVGIASAAAVGLGAFTLTSSGSSLASNSVPTSTVASTSNATSTPNSTGSKPNPRRGLRIGNFGQAVYSEVVTKQVNGTFKTLISVDGSLKSISPTSIAVTRPDTGATITAAITSTTKFFNTTESALAADLSSNTAVTVRLVETSSNAVSVSVPPPPGTYPKRGVGRFGGAFPPRRGTPLSSSASA